MGKYLGHPRRALKWNTGRSDEPATIGQGKDIRRQQAQDFVLCPIVTNLPY